MGKISKKQVEHIAKLAKLKLNESEKEKFALQLSKVISYVYELSEVETELVEPTSQTTGLINVKREDEIKTGLTQDEVLAGTGRIHNAYFMTRAALEKRNNQ